MIAVVNYTIAQLHRLDSSKIGPKEVRLLRCLNCSVSKIKIVTLPPGMLL